MASKAAPHLEPGVDVAGDDIVYEGKLLLRQRGRIVRRLAPLCAALVGLEESGGELSVLERG